MRYTVTWSPAAENQLAMYWMRSTDQIGITRAANAIDRELRSDPETKAVPHEELFVYLASPLAVLLRISPDDRLVEIIEVLPFARPGQ